MGRYSKGVRVIDEAKSLSISEIKKWGLFGNIGQSSLISWYKNKIKTGTIDIKSGFDVGLYLELSYTYDDSINVKYRVDIVYQRSNLNNGLIPYFLCPISRKKCRKLYLLGKYFVYREAYKNSLYQCQIDSKKVRDFVKVVKPYYTADDIRSLIHSKNFKQYYNGTITRRYSNLKMKLDAVNPDFYYRRFIQLALIGG